MFRLHSYFFLWLTAFNSFGDRSLSVTIFGLSSQTFRSQGPFCWILKSRNVLSNCLHWHFDAWSLLIWRKRCELDQGKHNWLIRWIWWLQNTFKNLARDLSMERMLHIFLARFLQNALSCKFVPSFCYNFAGNVFFFIAWGNAILARCFQELCENCFTMHKPNKQCIIHQYSSQNLEEFCEILATCAFYPTRKQTWLLEGNLVK